MLVCVLSAIASPPLTTKGGNDKSRYRGMPLPDVHSFLSNSYGYDYLWNTRGSPINMEYAARLPSKSVKRPAETRPYEKVKRPSSQSSIVFRENVDTPLIFPNTLTHLRNGHEEMTNAWHEGNGIEQRMLMPEGYSIPEEMYGPNYIWETKGWPRLAHNTPQPMLHHMKNAGKTNLYKDSPIIFEQNLPAPFYFPNNNHPKGSQQNNYKNNFLKENPKPWTESVGIEQRMLLPEGQRIPEKMFGPNYIWDTKGWPKFVGNRKV